MKIKYVFICLWAFLASSCGITDISYSTGDIKINIEAGEHWLHDFPLFLGLSKDNPPQFAVWLEDTSGNYYATVFVTHKIATEAWLSNNGNRRKEALPHWCHQRGIVYEDGLYLPTQKNPLADGITGATPKQSKEFQLRIADFSGPLIVKAEFNHSIDFNEYFPKNAKPNDENYSGGKEGSGQPAVVYMGMISPNQQSVVLQLVGRSSADGSDGLLYTDLEKLTTAKSIVKQIKIEIMQQDK